MAKILIENGHIIDPANHLDIIGAVSVADNKIISVGDIDADFTPDLTLDAKDKIVCPGFIDLSVRLREPGQTQKGNIQSETRAAAAAGVTSLCLPPDTQPIIDSPAAIEYIRDKAVQAGYDNVLPIGAASKQLQGVELSNMFALKKAGCIAISNANRPLQNLLILRHIMEYAVSHQQLLILRADEASLSKGGCLHEGAIATQYGLSGIPAAAETIAVAQTLELVKLTGCRIHFSQISCQGSAYKIQQAQKEGLKVSCDVAIHQLHLTEQDLIPFDSRYHVIPPLRSQSDKMALREALAAGSIMAICSDHQPHDLDAKLGTLPETEPGIASLQTLLPLTLQLVNDNALTLNQAIALLTSQPAQLLSLDKGSLTPDKTADICIFDPNTHWTVDNEHWLSAGKNTPFWGKTLQGQVIYTIQSGKIIYQNAIKTS